MEKLLSFLKSMHPLSASLQEYLLATVKIYLLQKKKFLIQAGHTCNYIYFVDSGLLRSFYIREDMEVSTWFMKEGDLCVSIESFYKQKPTHEYIQAIENTELIYIDRRDLMHICDTYSEFNSIAHTIAIKYINIYSEQFHGIRMQDAAERYKWFLNFHPKLILRVPQKYIASYLDIAPETLSKIRGQRF